MNGTTAPGPAASAAPAVSFWLAGVMALAVFTLQVVPVLAPELAASAQLAPGFVGLWSAGTWAAALAGTLAAPLLVARLGAWAATRLCLLACAAGAACVALGHPLGLLLAALLIGFGQGLEAPAASQLLVAQVPPARRALWFSVKQTGVQWGAIAASLLLPWLALQAGWRQAALAAGAAAAALALVLAWPAKAHPLPRSTLPAAAMGTSLRLLRQQPVLGWLALAAACFGAVQVVLNGFFVSFAVQERGASLQQAGWWLGAAQAGGLVGRVLWGWVAARLQRTLPILAGLGLVMAACSGALGLQGPGWVLLVLFGLSASGWNGIFLALVVQQVAPALAGSATAAVLVVMTLGLVLGPLAFGHWAQAGSYSAAFIGWSAVALVGCAALLGAHRSAGTAQG